ncbi:MAG: hypothetical protein AAFX87_24570 [Bacteroidota bacterium]
MSSKKEKKLLSFLDQKKNIYCEIEKTRTDGEAYTIKLTLWVNDKNEVSMMVEQFLDKHAFAEDLYERDEILKFPTVEEAISYLKIEFDIGLDKFHR